jgi:hypothetical protein
MKTLIAVAVATVVSGAAFAHSINGNDGSYDASMNNAFIQDGRAYGNGNGKAKGGFNFGMNFSGDADMAGAFDGNANNVFRNEGYGSNRGYYYGNGNGHGFPAYYNN